MIFSDLTFSDHKIKGATIAQHTFENGWTISVVAGQKDSGLYGIIGGTSCRSEVSGTVWYHREDTFEVAVIRSNGNMLDDVIPYQTPVQITTMMRLIEML